MQLTPNALKILEKRYLKGETPEQLFTRVAEAVASAEATPELRTKYAGIFYDLMASLRFLPNSPTLMNAGRELGQLSACFVIPVEDSMDGIFTAIHDMAMVQKSGGGTGFSFSRLRPAGAPVTSTMGVSSGPVPFLQAFDAAANTIKQGGVRRSANMAILRVDHPDIVDFINAKSVEGSLTNFNLSVGVTSDFMRAVEEKAIWELKWNGQVFDRISAAKLFDMIIEHSWQNGEPGVIFLDTINRVNPFSEPIEATNPCGEQPLLPYEACNLGSINLSLLAQEAAYGHLDKSVDYAKLGEIVRNAIRFLDDVIDVNKYPLKAIEEKTKATRKVGLGVMGWADLLAKLRIPYDSLEAIDLARGVMSFITTSAVEASHELALEKGPFPRYQEVADRYFCSRRNATVTTIAPTGTISMIASTTSGIEPIFALAYERTALDTETLAEFNSIFKDWVTANYPSDVAQRILARTLKSGSCQADPELDSTTKAVFKTATELSYEAHIKMQAAFQSSTENAVSKTINMPNSATKDDVRNAIWMAKKSGCKGLTVYRTGSRVKQVLNVKSSESRKSSPVAARPAKLSGFTQRVRTGCGTMFVTVNLDEEGNPIETFINTGASGGCSAFGEGIGRLISLGLRSGLPAEAIVDQLTSVKCPSFERRKARENGLKGKSCPDVIGRVIAAAMKEMQPEVSEEAAEAQCPECGATMLYDGGCFTCRCGYSHCG